MCQYDQGEQRQKLPAQGDSLSSTDWAGEPRWDLAFPAHRSSVCSGLVAAADSSTGDSQLRDHRIPAPPASSPRARLTQELTICPRRAGEGRTLRAQPVQWLSASLFLHKAVLSFTFTHRSTTGVFGSVFPTRNGLPLQVTAGLSNLCFQKSQLWT